MSYSNSFSIAQSKYDSMAPECDGLADWVSDGSVSVCRCLKCDLFFSTFDRAPSSICGRCSDPIKYPVINGKRAPWPKGKPVADYDNAQVETSEDWD